MFMKPFWCFLFSALAVLAGCASHPNLQSIALVPPPPGSSDTLRAQSVMLRDVTDERKVDGQTPGPRDIGRLPEGGPEGNIQLAAKLTVEGLVRETLANVLTGMGYRLEKDEGMVSSNDIVIDVTIDRFWGTVGTGGEQFPDSREKFMNGAITSTLKITGPIGKKQTLQLNAESGHNIRPLSQERDWREMYQALLEAYSRNALKGFRNFQQP